MPENTFTPEAAGLEDKNVVYTYEMLSQSKLKEISLALKSWRTAIDPLGTGYVENPGYSVTEDMANTLKDIATLKGGTPESKEFFNPLEAMAYYIDIIASVDQPK